MVIILITIVKKQNYSEVSLQNKQMLNSYKKIEFSTLLFGFYTAIIPFNQIMNFKGTGTINRYIGMLVISSLLISMLRKKQRVILKMEDISVFMFIIYILLSSFWSINQMVVISTTTSFTLLVILYLFCTNKTYSILEKNYIKICSIMGCLFLSIYLISTKNLFYNRVFIITSDGNIADPNGLSASIAFGILILFSYLFKVKKKSKILVISVCIIIMLYAMLLTGSRGGMVGLFFGVSIYLIMDTHKKKISKARLFSFGLVLFIMLLTIINTEIFQRYVNQDILERLTISNIIETGGTGRFSIWENSVQAFSQRPLVGYGFGNGPYMLEKYYGSYIGTHNIIFFLLLGTGIIGFILFSYFIFNIIKATIIKNDSLTLSMIIMLIVFSLSLDYILDKNFWNVMIYSQIGLGVINSKSQISKINSNLE